MTLKHAAIVDDERLARRELRTLLEEAHAHQIGIVGEAATVEEAARVVRRTDPDVVFLDIRLGDETGLDLLPHLDAGVEIVFVTAYDRFAIRAFEVNALDYLLKPVVPERLAATVERLEARAPRGAPGTGRLDADDRLFLRLDGRRAFLRVGDIVAVRADRDDTLLHLADGRTARTHKPLGEWEARLPERAFVRIHRSTIISLEFVQRVEEWSHGSFLVYLRTVAEPLTMSRRYAARVRALLG